MTDNEAIKELETSIDLAKMCTQNYERKREIQCYEMAIKALEEVQQYRAIGTPEELITAMKYVYLAKKHGTVGQVIENCVKYEEIGTLEECRAAMEKQTAKKMESPWCPCCGKFLTTEYMNKRYHCIYCGQLLEWSDEE